jgi:uncharacterized protein (TIGR02246 family)
MQSQLINLIIFKYLIVDEAAILALYHQTIDGWNKGSGESFVAPVAEDGDLVVFDGTHFEGRQETVPFHQHLFDPYVKGSRWLVAVVLVVVY